MISLTINLDEDLNNAIKGVISEKEFKKDLSENVKKIIYEFMRSDKFKKEVIGELYRGDIIDNVFDEFFYKSKDFHQVIKKRMMEIIIRKY